MSADTLEANANGNTDADATDVDAGTGEADSGTLLTGDDTQGEQEASSDADDSAGESTDEDAKEGAPEKYEDFVLPEGVQVNTEMLTKFQGTAKELNLTQEQAQSMVAMGSELTQSILVQQQEQWDATRDGWVQDLKSDPDYGGASFDKTVEGAKRVLGKYGNANLVGFLNETGYGDNSDFIRFLARVDKATAEDNLTSGDVPKSKRAPEDVMYDNMKRDNRR